MRIRLAAMLGAAVLLLAACSGASQLDETRADSGTGDLGSFAAGPPLSEPGSGSSPIVSADAANPDNPADSAADGAATGGQVGADGAAGDADSGDAGDAEGGQITVGGEAGGPATASALGLVPVAQGDSGDGVLALQSRLAEFGMGPGKPDGSYGRRTVAAVEAFQDLVGLEPTGDADAETITALARYRYDGLMLHAGDEGDDVEALQKRLNDGPFDPGGIDGAYGTGTTQAVWALEKLAGIPVDGDWGPLDEKAWERLQAGEIGRPTKRGDVRWVEVDLSQQLMKVYDPGATMPFLVSHVSSGSGIPWSNEDHRGNAVTPLGDFHIDRRISGWRESSLDIGRLYNPLYFNGGIALHGAASVPLYPASHGCVRLPMHVAENLPGELPNGTPVHVLA